MSGGCKRPHQTYSHNFHFKITLSSGRIQPCKDQVYSHNLHFKITEGLIQRLSLGRIRYCYIILRNVEKEKKVCPFFLLENSRPLSPWGPLDSLSTCLGTNFLNRRVTQELEQTLWFQFTSVQLLSYVWLFATPWTAAHQASLSITNCQSLFKLKSIQSLRPSNNLILYCPPFLLPSISPSIRVFSNQSVLCIRWPKYWSFSLSISPYSDHSGRISFKIDWLDLLAVQGTLKSLLQHHSSKASILQHSVFFMVQLSHLYMTTGKRIALTRRSFVGKVTCLLFNMLSRLVIVFLSRSNHLLISWLQSPTAVILEPP